MILSKGAMALFIILSRGAITPSEGLSLNPPSTGHSMKTPFTTTFGGSTEDSWVLHFESASHEDWGTASDEAELHATYQETGLPYVVTNYTYDPAPVDEDDLDWYRHPSLTAEQRNPSLC